MSESLEKKLRKHDNLVGTKIRLQDGEEWVFPACPLEGPASEAISRLLVEFQSLGDEPEASDIEGKLEEARRQNRIVLDLAVESLRINYPEVAREQLVERITKAHVLPIVRAVNGIAELSEFMNSIGSSDDQPVRSGNA